MWALLNYITRTVWLDVPMNGGCGVAGSTIVTVVPPVASALFDTLLAAVLDDPPGRRR